jgi:hypothetical protein
MFDRERYDEAINVPEIVGVPELYKGAHQGFARGQIDDLQIELEVDPDLLLAEVVTDQLVAVLYFRLDGQPSFTRLPRLLRARLTGYSKGPRRTRVR